MKNKIPGKIFLWVAAALVAAPRAQIGSGGDFVAGSVVDAKGYPLRNVFIAADGAFDTTDVDGKFGPGRKPIAGIAAPTRGQARLRLTGALLHFDDASTATLFRASGTRLVTHELPPGPASIDLEALAGDEPGPFVLRLAGSAAVRDLLLIRSGGGWAWAQRAATTGPTSTSTGSAPSGPTAQPARTASGASAKAAALPATVRIAKPGYLTRNVPVPPGGDLGKVTLSPDWTSPILDAPFDVQSFYAPSGWMGDYGEIAVAADNADNPRPGDVDGKNTRWTYTPPGPADTAFMGWAAVGWQYPENNWGDKPGRKVTGATKITFWAKGSKGGEAIDFKAGTPSYDIPPEPGKYKDSFLAVNTVELTTEWQRYEIPFDPGAKLDAVLTGFIWAMAAPTDGQPAVFYLDDMRFE